MQSYLSVRANVLLQVLALVLLSSCSFGVGPELMLPSSSDESTNENAVLATETGITSASSVPESVSESLNPDSSINISTDAPSQLDQNASDSQSGDNANAEIQGTTDIGSPIDTAPNSNASRFQSDVIQIPATDQANAPKINGNLLDYIDGTELLDGEWRFAVQSNAANESLDIGNLMFGSQPTPEELIRHHWAAMHDGEYLYLLVVSDDAGEHYLDTLEPRKPWKDDSIEIFIDGNNSQLENYDGVDDFHMTINLESNENIANSSDSDNMLIRQSDTSATLPSDLSFATGPGNGPVGSVLRGRKDIYEMRIRLSELNISLEQEFGIEIQINDDDNGGTRDTKWGWHHPAGSDESNDLTWQNPSVMGRAVLVR